ncbi:hypothetical protein NEOLEDRAFT_1126362 [Neolentinus lepideus HHB14362 ss-1]|uniref:Metallothionein n=1 Tax=Neolentinus lepideus HHB14362 ss-1 TaxID=1314782 RepID=A0A165W6J9_9AGAM|nr:hypothetical protein NEOLEDRAFT_1126362 [Neolentinus lepideus HHB14362 ss-1]
MPGDVKCQTTTSDCSWPNCACGEPPKNQSQPQGCGSDKCGCGASCQCQPGQCKC